MSDVNIQGNGSVVLIGGYDGVGGFEQKWIFPNDHDQSTWWPHEKRVLCVDKHGWIWIIMATDEGFERDDGSEPGSWPIAWMQLPERPEGK